MIEPQDPWSGVVLGDSYRLTHLIGQGGIGQVYEAEHVRVPRRFAVKILQVDASADAEVLARFSREAHVTAGLGHPNIVQVVDFDHMPTGEPYLVMELLEGKDLASVLAETPAVPLEWGLAVVRQVAAALEATHAQGVTHRDLKPENIFLCGDHRRRVQAKVMDFGVAKIRGSGTIVTSTVVGTPWYMAPEQATLVGEASDRADVWAVGVILYRLLTQRLPFEGENPIAVLDRVLDSAPAPIAGFRPDLPAPLVTAVERALEKDPGQRPTIGELLGAVERGLGAGWPRVVAWGQPHDERAVPVAWEAGGPAASPRDPLLTLPPTEPPRPRTRRAWWPFALVGGVVLGAGGALLLTSHPRPPVRTVVALPSATRPDPAARGSEPPPASLPLRAETTLDAGSRPADLAERGRRLWLASSPPGAAVHLGRQRLGETPLEGALVPARALRLRIRLRGHRDESLSVAPGEQELRLPAVRLRVAESATLSVTAKLGTKLVTAQIFLDGTTLGETPLQVAVPPGLHRLELRRGATRIRRVFRLLPGKQHREVFQLP